MTFAGFPDEALTFYEGLEADNSKSYWTDRKQVYDECVRAPMQALLDELADEFGTGKIFRPYRDVRFSKDKTPYKTHIGGYVGDTGHYVQLSADGLMVARGHYGMASDQLQRFRRAIDDGVQGERLESIVAALTKAKYEIGGSQLKSAPRGYAGDHPRIALLRHKGLYGYRRFPPEAWLHTRKVATKVRSAWRDFTDLGEWLAANVGRSDAAR